MNRTMQATDKIVDRVISYIRKSGLFGANGPE
jgi:hypothetical protein